MAWADREGTKKLVDIGARVLRDVVDGKWEEVLASELFMGTGLVWSKVVERG